MHAPANMVRDTRLRTVGAVSVADDRNDGFKVHEQQRYVGLCTHGYERELV